MIKDILFNIIKQCDMDTIKHWCLVDKSCYNMCQSGYFWNEKFKASNLTIMYHQQLIRQWMIEYNKVDYASNMTNGLSHLLKEHNKFFIGLGFDQQHLFASIDLYNNICPQYASFFQHHHDNMRAIFVHSKKVFILFAPNIDDIPINIKSQCISLGELVFIHLDMVCSCNVLFTYLFYTDIQIKYEKVGTLCVISFLNSLNIEGMCFIMKALLNVMNENPLDYFDQ